MITLKEHGLWSRWFQWSYSISQRFWLHEAYAYAPKKTDFCTLTRNIFLTAPLALLFNVVTVALIAVATFNLVRMLMKHLTEFGFFVALLLSVGFFIALVFFFFDWLRRVSRSETAKIVSTYVMAKKNKYCPTVEIKQ